MNPIYLLASYFMLVAAYPLDSEDCELYAPSTMHEFCCDIHDESSEFMDCQIEWSDKIHYTNDEQEMNYNFCVSECVYNATHYLGADRKSLKMGLIKHHLSELHGDEASEALMLKTYEMCGKHAKDMLEHKHVKELAERLKKYNCHVYPGLVFECVSNELILNCPPKQYHSNAPCDHAKDYLKSCLKHKKN
ncbi:uncharacterized protein LOC119674987 [Teleopsis dalmanni]|uniref:uncharacterized protein LOC119674987 n=1 Tax=Teleopsis dalmanni TaxID=139649 RepID=UPI0018CCEBDC|nr:uncharacterized protein LOC119674987 [Teleopsis dalmanni]